MDILLALPAAVALQGGISPDALKMIGIGLVMGLGLLGPGLGIGMLGAAAMNALGRNPEARGAILTNMILALAFAEALGIYALIVAILLVFVA